MSTPITIAQTLERARGLLSHLLDQDQVDQYKAREPARLGSTQLRNMLTHVSNIEARVADTVADPANAPKRLRDDIETLGPVKLRDVDEAQAAIVTLAKELAAQGTIEISEGKNDELVY